MQYKKLWYWIVATLACVVLVILYFLFLAPSAYSLESSALLTDSQQKNYIALDQQVIKDLGYQDSAAGLVRKVGDYYNFGVGPADNSGGGIEVVAHMKSDGRFEKVWSGQDNPPCGLIGFKVPAGIVPYCYAGRNYSIVVDRSNLIRTWYTLLFNPYVNKKGQVVYPYDSINTAPSPDVFPQTLNQTFEWIPSSDYSGWGIVEKNGNLHLIVSEPGVEPIDQIITGADPSTFEFAVYKTGTTTIPLGYFRDNKHVYRWSPGSGEPIGQVSGADVATFEVIPNQNASPGPLSDKFAKDKNHIYYSGYIVSPVDPATFSVLLDPTGFSWGYAKDKDNFYYIDDFYGLWVNIIPDVDAGTFTVLGNGYAKDKNHVWYNFFSETTTLPLPYADPATFTINIQPYCGEDCYIDAQDKNNKYNQGKITRYPYPLR